MSDEMKLIKEILHYPECWDVMAYPTVESAIYEALTWSWGEKECPTCMKQFNGE